MARPPIEFFFDSSALSVLSRDIQALGPASARYIFAPALTKFAKVIRGVAAEKNFIFRDGRGVRPFDKAAGRSRSKRLRSTLRTRQWTATYFGRKYRRGRSVVIAGGKLARHSFPLHEGHKDRGGGTVAPRPYLTQALFRGRSRAYNAFIAEVRQRKNIALAKTFRRIRRPGSSTINLRARRVALRGRRR